MKRTNTRAALLALVLTGCAAADVAVGAAVTDYALGEVAHEVAHACDCDSTKGPWASCQNGAGLCCRTCGKVCVVLEAKLPVPVPLPPQCDAETHCKNQESCVVGDHKCCATCHQACF